MPFGRGWSGWGPGMGGGWFGRGRGWGLGMGRGWFGWGPGWGSGMGRGWFGRGRGNPFPFCRNFPWMPRWWWAYGMNPFSSGGSMPYGSYSAGLYPGTAGYGAGYYPGTMGYGAGPYGAGVPYYPAYGSYPW